MSARLAKARAKLQQSRRIRGYLNADDADYAARVEASDPTAKGKAQMSPKSAAAAEMAVLRASVKV